MGSGVLGSGDRDKLEGLRSTAQGCGFWLSGLDFHVFRFEEVLESAGPLARRAAHPVRISGGMPGGCMLHAYVPVFPCHVQPL